jgi:hypothetical protein
MTPDTSSSDTNSAFEQLIVGFNDLHRHETTPTITPGTVISVRMKSRPATA